MAHSFGAQGGVGHRECGSGVERPGAVEDRAQRAGHAVHHLVRAQVGPVQRRPERGQPVAVPADGHVRPCRSPDHLEVPQASGADV
jgi:hypothetical protein